MGRPQRPEDIVLLEHERERILKVTFKRSHPASTHSAIYRSVVRAQCHFHHVHCLETTLLLRSWDDCWLRGTNGKDTRLRRVDDGSEVFDVVHAKVGHCERATLSKQ